MSTEQEIIRVPEDRGLCCHVGGQIEFDYAGNLYLSTGDDTNPFQSDGYTPIDDRETRNPAFDARRTSGNTNDLRGKILRIRVNAGGGYSIPNGNMFGRFQAQTRPEIYAMGFRNPFRFSVNRGNGDVYVGDYSPDANMANPARGPAGQGRWMLVRQPGNYGWPFCATPDKPYVDYDFTPGAPQSGEEFNCFAPTNDSRNNTGLRRLPQVVWPEVWYSYPAGDEGLFPELLNMRGGDGIGPMGGPAYEFNPDNRSETRWPRVFDGHPLFYEWTRDYFKVFELNRPNGGQLAAMHHLFGGPESRHAEHRPGQPDGRGLRPGRRALHAGVRRRVLRRAPRGAAVADRLRAPRRVHADRDGLGDADVVDDATADGPVLERGHARSRRGQHRLRVGLRRERHRRLASAEPDAHLHAARHLRGHAARDRHERALGVELGADHIGNQAPVVNLTVVSTTPPFNFGDTVTFTVQITDDQPVDCARVSVAYILGHDQHGHPQSSTAGCTGQMTVPLDTGHAGASNLAAVFVATYTDQPGGGETPQQGSDEVVLRPAPAGQ